MLSGVAAIRLLLKNFYYATPIETVWITIHMLWIFSKATPTYVEENKVVRWVRRLISRNEKRRGKTTTTTMMIRERLMTRARNRTVDDVSLYVEFSVFGMPTSSSGVGVEDDEYD